jgi:hypothetical protein
LIEENIYRLFLRGRPCFKNPGAWPGFTAFTAPQKHQKLETPRKTPRDTNGTEVSVLWSTTKLRMKSKMMT